jgi:transcription initiation factor TFIIB
MSSHHARSSPSEPASACPECGGRIDQSGAEANCADCGLVVDEQQLDRGPEWRSFDRDERKRTGAPRTVTRHDNGLSSAIGYDDSDAQGNPLSARKRRRLHRQRRLNKRAQFESKRQRNLAHGLGEIQRLTSALEVGSSVQQQASSVFRTAQDANLLMGRSIESGSGAAVYIACRCNTVVAMERIAEVARCSESHLWTTYKAFQRELSLPVPLQTPVDWVPRTLSNVPRAVSPALRQRAHDYAQAATEASGFAGKPACIAAACVYLASQETGEDWNQATVADAAETCDTALRNWLQKLEDRVRP